MDLMCYKKRQKELSCCLSSAAFKGNPDTALPMQQIPA